MTEVTLRSVSVLGSTGLVGGSFLRLLRPDLVGQVKALTRRPLAELTQPSLIEVCLTDFQDHEQCREALKSEILFCALGTTIKQAGSQQRFMEVDHDLPLSLARIAREEGCRTMVLISAMGANPDSPVFYSRVKGQLEQDLMQLGFEQLHLLRPGLLLGERDERRFAESIATMFMKPLRGIIPWRYRPISGETLARKAIQLMHTHQPGVFIHEGRDLFF